MPSFCASVKVMRTFHKCPKAEGKEITFLKTTRTHCKKICPCSSSVTAGHGSTMPCNDTWGELQAL